MTALPPPVPPTVVLRRRNTVHGWIDTHHRAAIIMVVAAILLVVGVLLATDDRGSVPTRRTPADVVTRLKSEAPVEYGAMCEEMRTTPAIQFPAYRLVLVASMREGADKAGVDVERLVDAIVADCL